MVNSAASASTAAEFTELNAKFSATWPVIAEKKDAMDGADEAKDVENKRADLSEAAFSG